MVGLGMLGAATATLTGWWLAESALHRRRLGRIAARVHVAGTRGKSSVTRLIASGLRAAGRTTVAKTTGTLPRVVLPDGREVPVFRPTGANLLEQLRIVAAAHDADAEALVLECMALRPELHWVSERHMVRATHGVITNVHPDHLEIMGPGEADVARCLAGMTPVGGVLYTAEDPDRHLGVLAAAAADRGSRLVHVGEDARRALPDGWQARFRYTEHPDNVALALRVLTDLGVSEDASWRGLTATPPDPGALTFHTVEAYGRRLHFANAFAANDPWSTERVWRLTRETLRPDMPVLAVVNVRADRPHRTLQLVHDTPCWREASHVVLVGTGRWLFARFAAKTPDTPPLVHPAADTAAAVYETLLELSGPECAVIGIGNIGGVGLELVRHMARRTAPGPSPRTSPGVHS